MQPSSFVFEKKSYHEQNIPTFTCLPKPVFDEILEELRPRFTQHKNSVGQQHMMTHDPGSQRSAEIQMTDDELNIEAADLRSEST